MMKDFDDRYAYVVSLKTRTIRRSTLFYRFERFEDAKCIHEFPTEIPIPLRVNTYDAEVRAIYRSDSRGIKKHRIARDEDTQELVDLFVELERNETRDTTDGLRSSNRKLQRDCELLQHEIDNFITWKNVKRYLTGLFK